MWIVRLNPQVQENGLWVVCRIVNRASRCEAAPKPSWENPARITPDFRPGRRPGPVRDLLSFKKSERFWAGASQPLMKG